MKKTILLLIIFAALTNVSAQIKVNSSGNVGIGKDPLYKLDVAGDIYIGSTSNILGTTNSNAITFKVNGSSAGFSGSSSNTNMSFGFGSLPNPLAGTYNSAIGFNALNKNTTGSYNVANGYIALSSNTTGNANTANGSGTLMSNINGIGNTANGNNTLGTNTSGSYNTAFGKDALYSNTIGSNNTAIGYYAGGNNPNNLTNSTAIGYQASVTASNQVRIGNSSIISIGGYANCSNISDGRVKRNLKEDVPELNFINLLQPVTYNLYLDAVDNLIGIDKAKKDKMEKDMPQDLKDKNEKAKKAKQDEVQTGFVAQDVEKAAKKIGYNFNGVSVDESGIYSLSYGEFVVPLVKAVQELSEKNDAKDAAIASLEQNAPNPFNHSSIIRYNLPETCTSAKILITNTGGSVLQQLPLSVSDRTNSITIKGHSMPAGVYLYTLICDGKTVDTKRMVLTK